MSRKPAKEPTNWYFTVDTNARGLSYVYAYQTRWDPLRKQPRRSAKRYVGRLLEDKSVRITAKFREEFPEYADGTYFYGASKQLVTELEHCREEPEAPGPKPDPENTEIHDDVSFGLTWAANAVAKEAGIISDLQAVFGEEDGTDLFNLIVYTLDEHGALDAFGLWRQDVYLPQGAPMSGQRVSELLNRVGRAHFDNFFSRRHKARVASAGKDGKLHYAIDSTSISTYSKSIPEAAFGHAKRDPDLKQINYLVICDQKDNEIVYAHAYDGSIPDVSTLQEILALLENAGFDLTNVVLITDRGYSSIWNIQKMINLELQFIQGVRTIEDSVKTLFDKHMASLRSGAFFDSKLEVFARTVDEPWEQNSDSGRLAKKVCLHLYRFPGGDERAYVRLLKEVDEIIELKSQNKSVSPDLWRTHRRFLTEPSEVHPGWGRNLTAIEKAAHYEGLFVIRSNVEMDPFKALSAYNMRGAVEFDFNQFKNWIDGDRVRSTASSYIGKLFINTVATSLRLMMLKRAHDRESATLKIPYNSIDYLLKVLRQWRARKTRSGNAWVARLSTKKQRDMVSLLGLPMPGRILK